MHALVHFGRENRFMTQESNPGTDITVLLEQIRSGDEVSAREKLFDVVYEQLLWMARGQMRGERANHTLGASALVNEAFLKISGDIRSKQHRRALFGTAADAMKKILIDHARKRNADKRLGKVERQPLDDMIDQLETNLTCNMTELSDALDRLGKDSPRQRTIVELKFFGGQSIAELAEHLGCSSSTVESDWRLARAKLFRWLRDED